MTKILSTVRRSRLAAIGVVTLAAVLALTTVAPTLARGNPWGFSGRSAAQSGNQDHGQNGGQDRGQSRGQDQDRGQNRSQNFHDPDHHGHGAWKVRFYDDPTWTCPTGAEPAADAESFGFAILNTTADGMLNVTVVLKGAKPNATYDLWVNQDPGACPLSGPTKTGALHTNLRGNGAAHLRISLVKDATHFWVSATTGTDVLRTPAAELWIKKP